MNFEVTPPSEPRSFVSRGGPALPGHGPPQVAASGLTCRWVGLAVTFLQQPPLPLHATARRPSSDQILTFDGAAVKKSASQNSNSNQRRASRPSSRSTALNSQQMEMQKILDHFSSIPSTFKPTTTTTTTRAPGHYLPASSRCLFRQLTVIHDATSRLPPPFVRQLDQPNQQT